MIENSAGEDDSITADDPAEVTGRNIGNAEGYQAAKSDSAAGGCGASKKLNADATWADARDPIDDEIVDNVRNGADSAHRLQAATFGGGTG